MFQKRHRSKTLPRFDYIIPFLYLLQQSKIENEPFEIETLLL